MTGWRLGYGVMPVWLAAAVERLMVNSNSCTASFTQRAGMAALQGPQDCVDAMVAEFRKRRDAIVAGLERHSRLPLHRAGGRVLRVPEREGHRHVDSQALADLLLNEAGVSCLSGTAFGELRRRLPALQLREFAGEHRAGAEPDSMRSLDRLGRA